LGCQARVLGRPRAPDRGPGSRYLVLWLAEATTCRHLTRSVTSLGLWGGPTLLAAAPGRLALDYLL